MKLFTSGLFNRGTWLEYLTDDRRAALGRLVNMKVDKHTIASTILFKAFGLSLDIQEGEDTVDTTNFKKFLNAMNLPVNEDKVEIAEDDQNRDFLSLYSLLYTSFFGGYQELVDTLAVDKTVTFEDSLRAMFENQRADEIPTSEVPLI